jgi:hypothetical protein
MNIDDRTMQVEMTIAAARGRRSGQRREAKRKAPDPQCIPRISRLMALAIKFQDMVDRGEVRDYADLARLGYVSRARLTQIMNLLLLAPDIQERLLREPGQALDVPTESMLRQVCVEIHWSVQRRLYESGCDRRRKGA